MEEVNGFFKTPFYKEVITLKKPYSMNDYVDLHTKIRQSIRNLQRCLDVREITLAKIGIEVSNFQDSNSIQKFSRIAGLIEEYIKMELIVPHEIRFKMFNANEWFKNLLVDHGIDLKDWTHIPREQRKDMSLKFMYKYYVATNPNNQENMEIYDNVVMKKLDDISDAFWIAYYYDKCLNIEERHNEMLKFKRVKNQMKKLKKKQKEQV